MGLTEALGEVLAPTRRRRSAHDDGEILRDQPGLFGDVASDSTASRAIERIGAEELEGIKAARTAVRARCA